MDSDINESSFLVEFANLPRRFSEQGRHAFDHWQNEKLDKVTVANTPENLIKINKIFSFNSNFMQNIVDFRVNNFEITVMTQPFQANSDSTISCQTAIQAESIFRQYLAFLHAAREWDMDFFNFTKFQVLPGPVLRLGWELQGQGFPDASTFIPIFKKNRHLQFLNEDNYSGFQKKRPVCPPRAGYLFRSDDCASNLLYAHSGLGIKSNANLKIKINTKDPLQTKLIQNTLFHNLDSEETLFIRIAANDISLSDFFSVFRGNQKSAEMSSAGLVREFGVFLRQSAFQKIIMVVDGLAGKADGQFLRFLLESGDITGLTIILFNDVLHFDCDLELNENPVNPLHSALAAGGPAQGRSMLSKAETGLLKIFELIEVPIPTAVVLVLNKPGSAARIRALLNKKYLQENQQHLSLCSPAVAPAAHPGKIRSELARLAVKTDWPFIAIRHYIATENLPALEQYLQAFASRGPEKIAPGPASDLLVSHLPLLAKNKKLVNHFLEILIRTNSLALAERLLNVHADPGLVLTRLQAAQLALRKKEYKKLGQLLAGLRHVPEEYTDKWLYLNFSALEKIADFAKADLFIKKIRDPYFRSLAMIQSSDRKIYNGDYAKARTQLDAALDYFQAHHCCREEFEVQNQLAKLQRETGCFAAAEALYKTTFIKSETEGFRLNSAFTAVDLGNLYLENDNDFHAESWYQKALKLFEKEKNDDGVMLVNSNLVSLFINLGNWKGAENLLRSILARSEDKSPPVSRAIDILNWAYLEYVRLDFGLAFELTGRAAKIFAKNGNSKGLGECDFLSSMICFLDAKPLEPLAAGVASFSADQKIVWDICQFRSQNLDADQECRIFKLFTAIRSKKVKFAALAMLLKKFKNAAWLESFREVSQRLSEKSKNYFFYEYWYAYFELLDDLEHLDGPAQGHFMAMYDFFSMNKRKISAKLRQLRAYLDEKENHGHLFADARLVESYRQWRRPEDFFRSFLHEINKTHPVDWLTLHVFEKGLPLFKFSNSDLYKELATEMIAHLRQQPENQNFHLADLKLKFNSQEKFFFPFANTKLIQWPLAADLSASLVVAFTDRESYFLNFLERNREILSKFALLFQNFFKNEFQIHEKLDFIIGASEKVGEMKRLIAQVSKVDFSLLITGESGSGKELVAQAVHRLSPRAKQPFVSLNAAALPETLLEAELFGFKKGAFSGAAENRVGLLEAADRGTFFLDEIADLPINLQAKMLRVLQEKEIRRLGENKIIAIDIRLISASNKNLEELIMAGQFREDLFYRLQDLTIHIPPLRERREDIALLVGHFLRKFGYPALDPLKEQDIAAMFQNDRFPGNIRELESKIKNLITFNPSLECPARTGKKNSSLKNARRGFECSLLLNTLNETRWHKSQAAAKLGISRMALFNMLKKHKISK